MRFTTSESEFQVQMKMSNSYFWMFQSGTMRPLKTNKSLDFQHTQKNTFFFFFENYQFIITAFYKAIFEYIFFSK